MTANQATIIVKFLDEKKIQHQVASPIPEWHKNKWKELQGQVKNQWGGELVARGVFNSVSLDDIETLKSVARARSEMAGIHYAPPKFENYLALIYKATAIETDLLEGELARATQLIVKAASSWIDVEQCYHRPADVDPSLKRATRPVTFDAPNTDPSHMRQAHLLDAPLGVGARSLWKFEGADGAGQRFIDVERGWELGHKDLADANGRPRVLLVQGHGVMSNEAENIWHGTCVLGVVCATHNGIDVIGMAPRLASIEVLSYVDATNIGSSASAVMHAAARQIERDLEPLIHRERSRPARVRTNVVILIEAHALPQYQRFYFPVEIYPETFAVIEMATRAGISVIEPAGNGRAPGEFTGSAPANAVDLDHLDEFFKPTIRWKTPPRSLRRDPRESHSQTKARKLSPFADSGAIMVACAEHTDDAPDQWTRSVESNFGSRIDCFAAGQAVFTLDANGGNRREFGGTSSASAIVAGAALCLQGVAQAHLGQTLDPVELRDALRDSGCGTGSVSAADDKIGVMPDLVKIAEKWIGTR